MKVGDHVVIISKMRSKELWHRHGKVLRIENCGYVEVQIASEDVRHLIQDELVPIDIYNSPLYQAIREEK